MRFKFRKNIDFRKFFVTSDNHFGHNMMAQKIRGFHDTQDHDEFLIHRWNAIVPVDGTVLLFGDFSFHNVDKTQDIVDRLHGEKFIIPGNHDDSRRLVKWFGEDHVLPEIANVKLTMPENGQGKPDMIRFVACHYPLASWDGSDKGSLQLHGHLHSQNNQVSHHFCAPFQGAGSRFDIGIDNASWFGFNKSPLPIKTVWKKHRAKQDAWAELIDDPRYK